MKAVLVTLRIPIADEATLDDAKTMGEIVERMVSRGPVALDGVSIDLVELLDNVNALGVARARKLLSEGELL